MVKKGRTPATPSPLPDPKVWQWCKHPECQEKVQKWKLLNAEDQQEKMRRPFSFCAVFGEDYCWRHLPDENKVNYKTKIEEYLKHNPILTGANLYEVELRQTDLSGAFLQEAILLEAKLQNTQLSYVKLQNANLRQAKLQEADLTTAKLQEADLWRADLRGAELDRVELHGASLSKVQLNGAKNLTWECLRKLEGDIRVGKARVGEEKWRIWNAAQDAYRNLKNYFHQQGLYEDEAKAYYQEKLMAKHETHEECFKKKQPKSFFRWLGLWILWAVAGFGERWMRTVYWAAGTFAFFGLLYWWGTNAGWAPLFGKTGQIKHLLDCLYFSLVTFVTLGFGDIWPAAWLAKIFVGLEVVMGYVFLGMIVVLIARKFGR